MATANIEMVKKHIKNLMNSHSLGAYELRELFKEAVKETIEVKVQSAMRDWYGSDWLEKVIRAEVKRQFGDLMKESGNTSIEETVKKAIEKKFQEELKDRLLITLKRPQPHEEQH